MRESSADVTSGRSVADAGGDWSTATARTAFPSRALGTLLGCATALAGALHFLVAGTVLGPLLLRPRTRPGALRVLAAGARRLTALERARRSVFFGDRFPEHYEASDRKVLRHLAVRVGTGLLCGVVVGLLG
ncbi:sensor histidine kinase, partial [Streptomyces cinereoruber]